MQNLSQAKERKRRKMPKINKEKPVTAQELSSTPSKPTTSSISADPVLGHRVVILIHNFLQSAKEPDAQRRMDAKADVNYMSGPHFDEDHVKKVGESTMNVEFPTTTTTTTQVNYDDENEESHAKLKIKGLSVDDAIKTLMKGFLDKRRASRDSRCCGSHDVAPIYEAFFFFWHTRTHLFGTAAVCTGPVVQMSALGGSFSERSDAASPMSTTSDTSDEGVALEIDDSEDNDSTLDDRMSSYTKSVTSSATDYPTEYGRRYHAFRAGGKCIEYHAATHKCLRDPAHYDTAYFAPNDEDELGRLDFNHELVLKILDYNLFLAPIDEKEMQRVLDIGTGTGIWAIEMGDTFPNAQVCTTAITLHDRKLSRQIIGNDLSATQPNLVPSNVRFEIDDVESDWLYEDHFDFIFSRYMAGSLSDWPTLISRAYENLRPGGWIEFQDYDFEFSSHDGSLTPNHYTYQWDHLFMEAARSVGLDPCPGSKLEAWVREAGFVKVTHRLIKVPIGPWAKDQYHKDIGMGNLIQLLDGLEAFTLRLFCGILGWTEEKVSMLLSHVRQELRSGAFHAYGKL
ncbi:methyltransferase domain-containing protein [Colletotrichum orchidophilum]|uniref:Methyltransferase domain-containing protein n=1 Tax=Colletotrichum orchidophilum TaxID=1209926 RepID=A0A1G4B2H5_9PEZI|nr:methyltransferase domain-containing protein [Colletotrichum orchidophilum]OHE95620.1 methyltransferase domain-containing protein [Colletotrichum orchidophilum]